MANDLARNLRLSIRKNWFLGFLIITICFGGFGIWASLSNISSAAIASGQVSPDGSLRTIQHLEGGIVRQLQVREGDLVAEGQPLVLLDKALAEANYQSTRRKIQRLRVVRERLLAQEAGKKDLKIPSLEKGVDDRSYQQFVRNEKVKFLVKNKLISEQQAVYDLQQQQVKSEISSLRAQIRGMEEQLSFVAKELLAKKMLVQRGLSRKPEMFALERKRAELSSEISALDSTIARAGQKIEEIKLAKISLRSEALEEITEELTKVNSEIAQLEEALTATNDVLSRTLISSPIDGRVLKLNNKTIGGVVRPGEPIMTIVPANEELLIDSRLRLSDIDNVRVGMRAKIQITSFMARHMVPLDGEVIQIGADAESDPDTGERFYNLRVRVDDMRVATLNDGVKLLPGMPAEVFVQTGRHTPLRYLLDPLRQSFRRAFREDTT
ncbi:HlyD family type I secretion periplasmic adaptor subunit [Polycladidibacter hongkongensis]|uniref:HlyD family type I secretion periplasmic adaptor subunit n=1 Tax=Polycladidibacter hongkongensis TaxID=1647556 RepID=UPI00083597A8|nr:HlyD family type I secretion periplasmic adaptor subunit [Pseudovibrio hongkongensis]